MALKFDRGPFGMSSVPASPGVFRQVKVSPRSRKTKTQIQVRNSVEINYTSVKDAIEQLAKAGEGLEDATLEIDTYEEYGSIRTDTTVDGWRDATDEEIQDKKDYDAWQVARRREQEEKMAEDLKRARPDLF